MTVNEGYMASVKEAIANHISSADASLSPVSTHVILSTDEAIWKFDPANMPIVTVRIGPSTDREFIQGRQLGNSEIGNYVAYFFTAHVFANSDTTGDASKSAMNLAETIKEKLLRSDDEASGIKYYYELVLRETVSNMINRSRVIIEGYVLARRPFDI